MEQKVYLVYEQVYYNNKFVYDEDKHSFISKKDAYIWMEKEKIKLIEKGYTIIEKPTEKDEFAAKLGDITRWLNIILASV